MDRSKSQKLDYLVMDDFLSMFALDKSDLVNARNEAEM